MKQTVDLEKMDPLTRIQEEIKEVVRREQEHKQFISGVGATNIHDDGHDNNEPLSIRSNAPDSTDDELITDEISPNKNKSFSNGHHSDDSGISGASSPVHGNSTNLNKTTKKHDLKIDIPQTTAKETRYIRTNCYNLTPEPPQQKLIQTIPSTPNTNAAKNRKFNMGPAQKGLMQRFIASRGKMPINTNNDTAYPKKITLRDASVLSLINNRQSLKGAVLLNEQNLDFDLSNIQAETNAKPFIIERDEERRPLRPGYIPVEVKIKRELRDLKSRESELRKMRKIRQSNPDLLKISDDDDSDNDVEHCFGLNKLRGSKSICDLSESNHIPHIFASSNAINEEYHIELQSGRYNSMKPAVSLAQLCELGPEEQPPSSHLLIAKFESLIQKNA